MAKWISAAKRLRGSWRRSSILVIRRCGPRTSGCKDTTINEKFRLQFRAEVFNLMNSFFVVAQQFNNNAENVNFGSVIKAQMSAQSANYPRQIQLGLKLVW